MVPICRRHLFAAIRYTGLNLWWLNKRSELLLSNPSIATQYVKNVYLNVNHPLSRFNYEYLQMICASSSPIAIEILSNGLCDWKGIPGKTKSTVLALIHVPTVRHLTIDRIENFPAASLLLCSRLNRLVFRDVHSISLPDATNATRSLQLTSLVVTWQCYLGVDSTVVAQISPTFRVPTVAACLASIIALDRLINGSFTVGSLAEVSQMCQLLERMICLESLELSGTKLHIIPFYSFPNFFRTVLEPGGRLAGLSSSLLANPLPKLRSVTFDLVDIDSQDDTLLLALNSELRQLAGRNVIEELERKATRELDTVWRPDTDTWTSDFDQLVADVEAFPALRKVTVCGITLPLNRGTK